MRSQASNPQPISTDRRAETTAEQQGQAQTDPQCWRPEKPEDPEPDRTPT
ncbi:unnamed protein product [marine sediment metagenome]|uniref:Uncharacterized protein n=1 Tax=marine sediment metagenome TaxID=412755 RepID=X1SVS5_9ZZZZ